MFNHRWIAERLLFILILMIGLLVACSSPPSTDSQGTEDIDQRLSATTVSEASTSIQNNLPSDPCADSQKASFVDLWQRHVAPVIDRIDIYNGTNLYGAQTKLMFPAYAVLNLGCKNFQKELVVKLNDLLLNLPYLADLRQGTAKLDDFYRNPDRSGTANRRIFPKTNREGEIYFAWGLEELQFSYLISTVAKYLVKYSAVNPLSDIENQFLLNATGFLANEFVAPLWTTVEAGWYPEVGNFPNVQQRLSAKLYGDVESFQKKSYYRGITDHELFFFAIAADLRYIASQVPRMQPLIEDASLEQIMAMADEVVKQRSKTDMGGFLFDVGVWDDHPDHAYAGYYDLDYPQAKHPAQQGSWDSSHSHRWPWWLASYRDAYPPESEQYLFYDGLLQNLANQFAYCVVEYDAAGSLLNNYMDGRNGWYRVRETWGYGPYTLSSTAIYGSWYLLGAFHPEVVKFRDEMARIARSSDADTIAFRTAYYGDRDYENPEKIDRTGLRSIDILGTDSLYNLNLLFAELMDSQSGKKSGTSKEYAVVQSISDEALLWLDFGSLQVTDEVTWTLTTTDQQVSIQGPVEFVDGPYQGAQGLAITTTTRVTPPSDTLDLRQGSLTMWARATTSDQPYSDLVRVNSGNQLYIYRQNAVVR